MKVSRKQIAVYWAPLTADGLGQPTYADPVEIAVRWEDKNEIFISKEGTEERSISIAYPAVDVVLEGCLWLGALADLPSDDSPHGVDDVRKIKALYNCPGVSKGSLSKVWLL